MFRENIGRRNFERCELKQVITVETYTARLDCAVTGEEGFEVYYGDSSSRVLPRLAKAAGETICRGCPYAQMTREELHQKRAGEAEAEALRLEAEHRLMVLKRKLAEEQESTPLALPGAPAAREETPLAQPPVPPIAE